MPDLPDLPPVDSAPLSAVFLAYNAENYLEQVLQSWRPVLDDLKRPYEILLVDDGSSDETAARAETLISNMPTLRVLRLDKHRGPGAALRAAVQVAQHPLLFYTLCDLQFQPGDLAELVKAIDKVHLVATYRVMGPVPAWLRCLGSAYRGLLRVLFGFEDLQPLPGWLGWRNHARQWLARWFFGVRVQDVGSFFTLCRREIFERIPLQSDGPFVQTEILAKANFLGRWMDQVPVSCRPEQGKYSRIEEGLAKTYFQEAWRLLCRADFGGVRPQALPAPAAIAPAPAANVASPALPSSNPDNDGKDATAGSAS